MSALASTLRAKQTRTAKRAAHARTRPNPDFASERMKAIRNRLGLTQAEFGNQLGISQSRFGRGRSTTSPQALRRCDQAAGTGTEVR